MWQSLMLFQERLTVLAFVPMAGLVGSENSVNRCNAGSMIVCCRGRGHLIAMHCRLWHGPLKVMLS